MIFCVFCMIYSSQGWPSHASFVFLKKCQDIELKLSLCFLLVPCISSCIVLRWHNLFVSFNSRCVALQPFFHLITWLFQDEYGFRRHRSALVGLAFAPFGNVYRFPFLVPKIRSFCNFFTKRDPLDLCSWHEHQVDTKHCVYGDNMHLV